MKKMFVISLLVLILTLGCAQKTAEKEEIKEKSIVIGEIWEIESADPVRAGTLVREKAMLVENLVGINPDLSLRPWLAISWTQLDEKTWIFELRKGVKFHNGKEIKASDVKWSIERALRMSPPLKSMTMIDSVEVIDDYRIKIKTEKSNSILPATLAYSDLAIISPDSELEGDVVVKPIGTGPFKFVEWRPAEKTLIVEKFNEYWGSKAKVDKLIFKAITDPSSRTLALEAGEVDLTYDFAYGDIERLKSKFKVELYSTNRVYQITFGSVVGSYFEDPRVRKAISMAIDREGIARALHGAAEPAYSIVLPNLWWAGKRCEYYEYNPEKARKLLEEAGWRLGSDGVLEKDGKKFEITIYTYPQRPGLKPMAEVIAKNLEGIGIRANIRVMEYSAIPKFMKENDIRLAAFHQTMVPDPDYYLRRTYAGDFNTFNYSNQKLNELLDKGIKTVDIEERKKIYTEVQEIVCEDLPVIHVAFYKVPIAYKPNVKNVIFNPAAHDIWLNHEIDVS